MDFKHKHVEMCLGDKRKCLIVEALALGVLRPNTTGGVGRAVHALCREAMRVGKCIMEMTVRDMKAHGLIKGGTGSEKCDRSCMRAAMKARAISKMHVTSDTNVTSDSSDGGSDMETTDAASSCDEKVDGGKVKRGGTSMGGQCGKPMKTSMANAKTNGKTNAKTNEKKKDLSVDRIAGISQRVVNLVAAANAANAAATESKQQKKTRMLNARIERTKARTRELNAERLAMNAERLARLERTAARKQELDAERAERLARIERTRARTQELMDAERAERLAQIERTRARTQELMDAERLAVNAGRLALNAER